MSCHNRSPVLGLVMRMVQCFAWLVWETSFEAGLGIYLFASTFPTKGWTFHLPHEPVQRDMHYGSTGRSLAFLSTAQSGPYAVFF